MLRVHTTRTLARAHAADRDRATTVAPARRAAAPPTHDTHPSSLLFTRRTRLAAVPTLAVALSPPAAVAGAAASVESYLPASTRGDGYVTYTASKTSTPSVRAGVLDAAAPYTFDLPASGGWRAQTCSNVLSGQFCMPRCDEPFTEVIFSSEDGATARLVVSPLRRVSRRAAAASATEVGTSDGLLGALGPFITNNIAPDESEVVAVSTLPAGGDRAGDAYLFETNTPYGLTPPHAYATVAAKGAHVYLFVVAAPDKAWGKLKGMLRTVAESFRP